MMASNQVKEVCAVNDAGKSLLKTAMERLGLSARAYDRILRVSRTVADLTGSPEIKTEHLAEAINIEVWIEMDGRVDLIGRVLQVIQVYLFESHAYMFQISFRLKT